MLIIKLFAFQFVNSYTSLYYIAFFRGVSSHTYSSSLFSPVMLGLGLGLEGYGLGLGGCGLVNITGSHLLQTMFSIVVYARSAKKYSINTASVMSNHGNALQT